MGPLAGVKIVEIAGIGPGPFCGMLLSDMGADVVRIDRKSGGGAPIELDPTKDMLARNRRSVAIDLKAPEGIELALSLIDKADGLIEGFRPGVTDRLGLGPDACLARNPRLVYGRMTGWGQTGPLSQTAGHDINYIALTGALHAIGRAGEKPLPPLNIVGDMAGGGLLLAFGMVCAILEAKASGKGQVVDTAMTEGASLMMAAFWGLKAMGHMSDQRGTNMGDTGSHFYDTYETSDGKFMAIGPIEPQFYKAFLERAGLDAEEYGKHMDPRRWQPTKAKFTDMFKTKTRDEWAAIFDGSDACVTPVLSMDEAPEHPHNKAREAFVEVAGIIQPAPAPKFSRTRPEVVRAPPRTGEGGTEALIDWGVDTGKVDAARVADALV